MYDIVHYLPTLATRALYAHGVWDIKQVCLLSDGDLLKIKGIGPCLILKIRDAIHEKVPYMLQVEAKVDDVSRRLRLLENQLYGEEDENLSSVVSEYGRGSGS